MSIRRSSVEAAVFVWAAVTLTSLAACVADPPAVFLAIATVALSLLAALAIASDRERRRAGAWVAALGVWAVASTWIASVSLPDALLEPHYSPHGPMFCVFAPIAGGIAAAVTLVVSEPTDALISRARPSAVLALAAIVLVAAATYTLTRPVTRVPTPSERLAGLVASHVVPPLVEGVDGKEQRIGLGDGVELLRECDDYHGCVVRVVSRERPSSRVARYQYLDRDELQVAVLPRAFVVAAVAGDRGAQWIQGLTFDRATLDERSLLVSDLPERSGAPVAWSSAASLMLTVALASFVLALRSLARGRGMTQYTDATIEHPGVAATLQGPARCDPALPLGPALLLLDPAHSTYRVDAAATAVEAIPGTRAQQHARTAHRTSALALAALLTTVAAVGPLFAAHHEDLMVAAPWAD